MNVAVNQINTVTGDLEGNFKKVISKIIECQKIEADIIVFPETTITGYCCGSLWENENFILDQWKKVYKLVEYVNDNVTVIVGAIDIVDGIKFNAVAVINNKKVEWYHKQLLANSGHHEDRKYFTPGDESKIFEIQTKYGIKKIGIPICEDAWFTEHEINVPKEMVNMGAEILIVPSQSFFYFNKQHERYKLFRTIAKDNGVPVIACNSIGVGDIVKNIIIYDGGSMIFNANGNVLNYASNFTETTLYNDIYTEPKDQVRYWFSKTPTLELKYHSIIEAIIFEQKELFKLIGLKNAQVHISGGIDSAIVAALVVEAMGRDRTILITNPTSLNKKSFDLVKKLAHNLDMEFIVDPLQDIFELFLESHNKAHGATGSDLGLTGQATIQATLRTVQGLAASHHYQSGIVATGNHTEIVLGWASFHDIGSIGVHAILGDLTKVELYQLAKYYNFINKKLIIPPELYTGQIKPAAELPDANEDPIDYYLMSGICSLLIRKNYSPQDLIHHFKNQTLPVEDFEINYPDGETIYLKYSLEKFTEAVQWAVKKMKQSVYKAAQGAPIVIMSPRSRGFSNRETIINKYSY